MLLQQHLRALNYIFSLVCSTSTHPATPKRSSLLRRAQEDPHKVLLFQHHPIYTLHHHIPSPGVTVYRASRQLGIKNYENPLF
jgi:hypothetical protein